MKADDYDAFIDDPGDWAIRKYWPRVFRELEGLSLLPPLAMAGYGTYSMFSLGALRKPPVVKALKAFAKAIEADAEAEAHIVRAMQRLAGLGFAPHTFVGCPVLAPFDFMSDTLRGMRGIMLDMYRRPEKLLAAEEKVLRFEARARHSLVPGHRRQCRRHRSPQRLRRFHVPAPV